MHWRDSFSHDSLRGKGVYLFVGLVSSLNKGTSFISNAVHMLAKGSYLKSTGHLDPKGRTPSGYGSSRTQIYNMISAMLMNLAINAKFPVHYSCFRIVLYFVPYILVYFTFNVYIIKNY